MLGSRVFVPLLTGSVGRFQCCPVANELCPPWQRLLLTHVNSGRHGRHWDSMQQVHHRTRLLRVWATVRLDDGISWVSYMQHHHSCPAETSVWTRHPAGVRHEAYSGAAADCPASSFMKTDGL